MENIELIFEHNRDLTKATRLKSGRMIYALRNSEIDGAEIRKIIRFINSVHNKYTKIKIPITLDFFNVSFADKLTYIMLECICYYLMIIEKHPLKLNVFLNEKNISLFTIGITSSPLLLINGKRSTHSTSSFSEKFEFDIYGRHYRKVFNGKSDLTSNKLGSVMNDIRVFLKHVNVSDDCSSEISETITELIGNAVEHTKSDCLIDIDVSDSYEKKNGSKDRFYGINIVVLNFSEKLLGDSLKSKIENPSLELKERYITVKEAYTSHVTSLNDHYTENDFYKVASFQHKISGSDGKIVSGGKGLTQLIKALEYRSDVHECYMMSGKSVLNFIHNYLAFNEQNWIGFNQENDFINHIPAAEVINYSKVYFPGTAYNLNFAMKEEENNEKE